MDITIFIPTINRPNLLLRLLLYLQSANFTGKIVVFDSSSENLARKLTLFISDHIKQIEIIHHHTPGLSAGQAFKGVLSKAETKYAVVLGDDDFLIPSGLREAINFLDSHSGYVAAHGVGISMPVFTDIDRKITGVSYYRQPVIEEATATQRFFNLLTDYQVGLFSVHRMDIWRLMFEDIGKIKDRAFGDELVMSCLSSVYGKTRFIDKLYLVRGKHQRRNLLPGWYEWITNDKWHPSYILFRSRIAEAISEIDNVSVADAEGIVDKALSIYMFRWISKQPVRYGSNELALLNDLKLDKLLNKKSKYHKDFMPVYNYLTLYTPFFSDGSW